MKAYLKAGVSAAALGLVLASPAFAFDKVKWEWTNKVTENININIDIDAANSFYPSGITQVERLQVSAGSMSSATNQDNTEFIVNNGGEGGPVEVELGQMVITDTIKIAHPVNTQVNDDDTPLDPEVTTTVEGIDWGTKITHVIDLGSITVDVPPGTTSNLDATLHLGRLEGNSTAAGNVASISSEVATTFHDGQIAFGNFNQIDSLQDALQAAGAGIATALALPTGNRYTDALSAAAIAAQFGLITQGQITASATAKDVLNAQVALNATGAGNLHSVTVGPAYSPFQVDVDTADIAAASTGPGPGPQPGPGPKPDPKPGHTPEVASGPSFITDNIVIGDLTQFSYMNVSASADASGLTINGFSNLGLLKDQYGTWTAASSVNASAFGNVSSITNRVNGLAPLPYVTQP